MKKLNNSGSLSVAIVFKKWKKNRKSSQRSGYSIGIVQILKPIFYERFQLMKIIKAYFTHILLKHHAIGHRTQFITYNVCTRCDTGAATSRFCQLKLKEVENTSD